MRKQAITASKPNEVTGAMRNDIEEERSLVSCCTGSENRTAAGVWYLRLDHEQSRHKSDTGAIRNDSGVKWS